MREYFTDDASLCDGALQKRKRYRNVLIVTRAFPPENSSAVHRPLKFTKYLPAYGWKPYVVTTKKYSDYHDNSLIRDIPPGIVISQVLSLDPATLQGMLIAKLRDRAIGKGIYSFVRVLLKAYSILYYRAVLIDWHDGWVPFGFFKAKQITKKMNVDIIFIDMEPPSSSVIGLLLKIFTNKPVVIDYHDPWTTSVYVKRKKGVKKKIAEYLEHTIVRVADKVTAGKDNIVEELVEKFPDVDAHKFTTIPSGYDPDDFAGIHIKKEAKFVIAYTGKLSEKFYYSPESFLYALSELIKEEKIPKEDVLVLFLGTVSSMYQDRFRELIRDLHLEGTVINTGIVNRKTCAEYQMGADVLLYIIESIKGKKESYAFSGVVPSKIYEYMYTGNPIMAIVPPGVDADLIRRTKTGFIAEPNNIEAVKALLFRLYKKYKDGTLKIDPDWSEVGKYDRKHLAGTLARVFDEIVTHKHTDR